eukprot:m.174787 g.174787  ORF g.174787 m.174787 type:complete len:337 (-) comp17905_c0_seq2:126-1136(-)
MADDGVARNTAGTGVSPAIESDPADTDGTPVSDDPPTTPVTRAIEVVERLTELFAADSEASDAEAWAALGLKPGAVKRLNSVTLWVEGRTALEEALNLGRLRLAAWLVRCGGALFDLKKLLSKVDNKTSRAWLLRLDKAATAVEIAAACLSVEQSQHRTGADASLVDEKVAKNIQLYIENSELALVAKALERHPQLRRHAFESQQGMTVLHLASALGDRRMCELLVQADADVEARDSSLMRPLHYAANNGHYHACDVLLRHGADVDPQNVSLETPAHLAVYNRHVEVLQLLMSWNADLSICDKRGQDVQTLARTKEDLGAVVDELQVEMESGPPPK